MNLQKAEKALWQRIILAFRPLIITIILYLLVFGMMGSFLDDCSSLPKEQQGECGTGWLGFALFVPFFFAFIITGLWSLVSFIKLMRNRNKDSSKNPSIQI